MPYDIKIKDQGQYRQVLERNGVVKATCSTAAATAAKVVTISGYALTVGDLFAIQYTLGSTASKPALNINGGGAKQVRLGGAQPTGASGTGAAYCAANGVVMYYYDGTYFHQLGSNDITDANTSSIFNLYSTSTSQFIIQNQTVDVSGTNYYPFVGLTADGTIEKVTATSSANAEGARVFTSVPLSLIESIFFISNSTGAWTPSGIEATGAFSRLQIGAANWKYAIGQYYDKSGALTGNAVTTDLVQTPVYIGGVLSGDSYFIPSEYSLTPRDTSLVYKRIGYFTTVGYLYLTEFQPVFVYINGKWENRGQYNPIKSNCLAVIDIDTDEFYRKLASNELDNCVYKFTEISDKGSIEDIGVCATSYMGSQLSIAITGNTVWMGCGYLNVGLISEIVKIDTSSDIVTSISVGSLAYWGLNSTIKTDDGIIYMSSYVLSDEPQFLMIKDDTISVLSIDPGITARWGEKCSFAVGNRVYFLACSYLTKGTETSAPIITIEDGVISLIPMPATSDNYIARQWGYYSGSYQDNLNAPLVVTTSQGMYLQHNGTSGIVYVKGTEAQYIGSGDNLSRFASPVINDVVYLFPSEETTSNTVRILDDGSISTVTLPFRGGISYSYRYNYSFTESCYGKDLNGDAYIIYSYTENSSGTPAVLKISGNTITNISTVSRLEDIRNFWVYLYTDQSNNVYFYSIYNTSPITPCVCVINAMTDEVKFINYSGGYLFPKTAFNKDDAVYCINYFNGLNNLVKIQGNTLSSVLNLPVTFGGSPRGKDCVKIGEQYFTQGYSEYVEFNEIMARKIPYTNPEIARSTWRIPVVGDKAYIGASVNKVVQKYSLEPIIEYNLTADNTILCTKKVR